MSRTALVVGYGSIGQRHARVLESLSFEVEIVSRRRESGGRNVHSDLSDALRAGGYDLVVLADETRRHLDSLTDLANGGFNGSVLVEKPLFAWPAPLPRHSFTRAGVGYNLRFHPAVRALRDELRGRSAQMADFYVGQWLGDWRPGQDVAECYSASRAAGGGALRDLSHELDLASWLFGDWRRVTALGGRLGSVTVDSDDGWGILLACERCQVMTVHLNCLDRVAHRSIVVQVDGETLRADLVAGTLEIDRRTRTFPMEGDATYVDLHRSLLSGSGDVCSLEQGLATVDLIAAIERAAAARQWIEHTA